MAFICADSVCTALISQLIYPTQLKLIGEKEPKSAETKQNRKVYTYGGSKTNRILRFSSARKLQQRRQKSNTQ